MPRPATYRELRSAAPDEQLTHGTATWWTRSQALLIGYSTASAGDELAVDDVDGEYAVLVLDGAQATIEHTTGSASVTEPAIAIVPPGASTVRVDATGTIIRVLAAATAPSLSARASNAADYTAPDTNVATFAAWPDPPDGHHPRVYPLSEHPLENGKLGRIFRCSTVMVNVLPEDDRPRDPMQLSPHHHDDFEQVSLQVHGDYVHHMRVPWTPDSSTWRDDDHRRCAAPAVVVIPPPARCHNSTEHEPVGRAHAPLADRRLRTAASRLLRTPRLGAQRRRVPHAPWLAGAVVSVRVVELLVMLA